MSEEPEADVAGADDADREEADDAPAAEAAGQESDEEPAAEEEEAAQGFQEGDFVRLAYTMRTVEDGNLVDTTDEAVAEEEGLDTEGQDFGPRTIVLGAGHVFEAVEDELIGAEVGDTGTVTIPAEEAFGAYDPDEVRTVSADRLPEDSRHPGAHVNLDGQHGHVETIIGGRARVDFNHPLAGEDVEYDYEVLGAVEDRLERAQGLLGMYLDIDLDMHFGTDEEEQVVYDDEGEEEGTETVEHETLFIEATPQLSMNQQWLFAKQQIAGDLIDRLGIDRVVVREVLDGGGGFGGLGGMGGMGGVDEGDLEAAIDDADIDADVDADEIVEELEADVPEAESGDDLEE